MGFEFVTALPTPEEIRTQFPLKAELSQLKQQRDAEQATADKLVIVPRVYTNKPRTTGEGYMGMIHQPDPEKKPNMLEGILAIRHMHMRVLEETGFSTADEMLYPENLRYLSDILSYIAVMCRWA